METALATRARLTELSRLYLTSHFFLQSYLELISLYKDLLARKREELRLDKERLENGVTKIAQASAQVSHLLITLCIWLYLLCMVSTCCATASVVLLS